MLYLNFGKGKKGGKKRLLQGLFNTALRIMLLMLKFKKKTNWDRGEDLL